MDINKIIARVKAILLSPGTEWPVIAGEPATRGAIYQGYVIPLTALAAACRFIGSSLIGTHIGFFGTIRMPVVAGLAGAVVSFVLSLVSVFVMATIVDALAPTFGGQKDAVQALKVVAYSYTASWAAAVLGIVPGLGILAAVAGAVYGIYLLYRGLPPTMKCPPDKAVAYTVVSIIAAIVLAFCVNLVVSGLGGSLMMRGMGASVSLPAGIPSGAPESKIEKWAQGMEQAGKQMEAAEKSGDAKAGAAALGQMLGALSGGAKVEPISPEQMKTFVPEVLDGLPRTEITTERHGALGLQVTEGRARYANGEGRQLELKITDLGSVSGVTGLASWAVQTEKDTETADGFEKIYKQGDRIVHEQWHKGGNYGQYSQIVGGRFSVEVSGNAPSIDALKAAVASVNLAGLEALKNVGVKTG
jgi:hypothetical protein